jgi:hypothetical protein
MTKSSEGERTRATHVLSRLKACLQGVEIALRDENTPIGHETGNAVMQTAFELGTILAKLDAYQRSELDNKDNLKKLKAEKKIKNNLTNSETENKTSNICSGCCYSDGRENFPDGSWICHRCGDKFDS